MAPPSKLAGLTPEEKISRERERNRRKSAALRARKKEQQHKTEEGGSSSSSTGEAPPRRTSKSSGSEGNEDVIKRLVARLAELGEGEHEIGKLVGGDDELNFDVPPPLAAVSSSKFELGTSSTGWDLDEYQTVDVSAGAFLEPPRAEYRSAWAEGPKTLTFFGALMNDAGPPFPPSSSQFDSDLSQLSHLSFPALSVDQIRLALNLSAAAPRLPPQTLPSYSYASFASSLASYPSSIRNDDDNVEWKWRLFEFLRVSYENRQDLSEGFLHNPHFDALVASAQLIVLKLLTSTSTLEQRAKFDSRRPLERQADHGYFDHEEMDPRIFHIPEPGPRLHISRVTQAGLMNLTELISEGMAICTIHGDVWDSSAWSMAKPPWPPLIPSDALHSIGIDCGPDQPIGLQHLVRGASIREIVLGIEKPGWRVLDNAPSLDSDTPTLASASVFPSLETCVFEKPFWSYWAKGWHAGSVRTWG